MSVDFLDHLPEHRAILEQALACYVSDDRVAGVMLYGSLAIGQGDEFSDIDLNILAVPKHRTELLTQAPETMRTFGDALFVFRADHLSPTQIVAHYANHVKLDLDFVLSEELGVYAERRRHRVFKDSTGELAKVLERSAALSDHYEVTSDQLLELNQRFWPWCYYAAAKATRGELWEARAGLEFIRAVDTDTAGCLAGQRAADGIPPHRASRVAAVASRMATNSRSAATRSDPERPRKLDRTLPQPSTTLGRSSEPGI